APRSPRSSAAMRGAVRLLREVSPAPDFAVRVRAPTEHAGGEPPADPADPRIGRRAIRLAVLQTHSSPSPCLRVLFGTGGDLSRGLLQMRCNVGTSFNVLPRKCSRARCSLQPRVIRKLPLVISVFADASYPFV